MFKIIFPPVQITYLTRKHQLHLKITFEKRNYSNMCKGAWMAKMFGVKATSGIKHVTKLRVEEARAFLKSASDDIHQKISKDLLEESEMEMDEVMGHLQHNLNIVFYFFIGFLATTILLILMTLVSGHFLGKWKKLKAASQPHKRWTSNSPRITLKTLFNVPKEEEYMAPPPMYEDY